MAKTVIFNVRFVDSAQVGQKVDADLYVELFESGGTTPKETRTLGSDINTRIVEAQDGQGYFYVTVVDVTNYVAGTITSKWYAKLNGVQITPYPFTKTAEYPADTSLTTSSLKSYILDMLGFPSVLVELTDSQVNTVAQRVLDFYNAYVGRRNYVTLTLLSGKNNYPLPNVGTRGVARVEFLRKSGFPILSDPMFGREFPRGHLLEFDVYQMGISHLETIRRTTAIEPEWQWNPAQLTLYIDFNQGSQVVAGGDFYVGVTYYDNLTLGQVPANHFAAVKGMAVGVAKEVLARIRGKFGGIVPGPSQATLDADRLADEAKAEIERWETVLRGLGAPVPFVTG
jgi:hypothetical protein